MIRGGYLDMTIMGTMEVSENGDLANGRVSDSLIGRIGCGVELARVWFPHCHPNNSIPTERRSSATATPPANPFSPFPKENPILRFSRLIQLTAGWNLFVSFLRVTWGSKRSMCLKL